MTTTTHPDQPTPAREYRLTDRDQHLLGFISAHRFVLAAHAQTFLDAERVPTYRRLYALVQAGMLTHRRIFHCRPGAYQVTKDGLAVIESSMPKPMIDLHSYRHDALLVAIYLHVRDPGSGRAVLSEREIRELDHQAGWDAPRRAITIGDLGAGGRPHLHHPDVLIEGAAGRVAFELELTLKSRKRLEEILIGYGGAPGMRQVVYLTDRPAIQAAVRETAARVGLAHLLEVRVSERRLTEADSLPPAALLAGLLAGVRR